MSPPQPRYALNFVSRPIEIDAGLRHFDKVISAFRACKVRAHKRLDAVECDIARVRDTLVDVRHTDSQRMEERPQTTAVPAAVWFRALATAILIRLLLALANVVQRN